MRTVGEILNHYRLSSQKGHGRWACFPLHVSLRPARRAGFCQAKGGDFMEDLACGVNESDRAIRCAKTSPDLPEERLSRRLQISGARQIVGELIQRLTFAISLLYGGQVPHDAPEAVYFSLGVDCTPH